MPQETIRYSRKSLHRLGAFIGLSFCLLAAYVTYLVAPSLEGKKLFAGLVILALLYFPGWLTLLHEGAHIAYAYAHGISESQMTMKTSPHRFLGLPLRWRTSLNVQNIPKSIWLRFTLFPFVIPAAIAALSIYSPMFIVLALLILAGSGDDLAYILAVLRVPGDFVTTTDNEVIISSRPLRAIETSGKKTPKPRE